MVVKKEWEASEETCQKDAPRGKSEGRSLLLCDIREYKGIIVFSSHLLHVPYFQFFPSNLLMCFFRSPYFGLFPFFSYII
jgi:hypothetical protein